TPSPPSPPESLPDLAGRASPRLLSAFLAEGQIHQAAYHERAKAELHRADIRKQALTSKSNFPLAAVGTHCADERHQVRELIGRHERVLALTILTQEDDFEHTEDRLHAKRIRDLLGRNETVLRR